MKQDPLYNGQHHPYSMPNHTRPNQASGGGGGGSVGPITGRLERPVPPNVGQPELVAGTATASQTDKKHSPDPLNGTITVAPANRLLHTVAAGIADQSGPVPASGSSFCGGTGGGQSMPTNQASDRFTNLLNSIVLSRRDELNNILVVGNAPFDDRIEDKSGHPLFGHGMCKWPGCELSLHDLPAFVK